MKYKTELMLSAIIGLLLIALFKISEFEVGEREILVTPKIDKDYNRAADCIGFNGAKVQ